MGVIYKLVSYNGKYNRLMSDESEFDSQHEHLILIIKN